MRNIPFGKPILGNEERAAVQEVLNGTQFVHGPRARAFEAVFSEFVGGGHALSVASCTAGLHLAYVHLGIGKGDEVIVPAQTHVATAHSVEYTGATPVFVDAEARTGNIDVDAIEAAITPRTRAISVVHYLGLPVDMGKVMDIARRHDCFVVEDCALAIGGRYRGTHVGLIGDVGTYSFYPVKHITTAEGGMVITRHDDVAGHLQRLKAFGYDKQLGERVVPGLYDVDMLGYNYRMNEMQAALGEQQMKRIAGFLETRARNAATLRPLLAELDGFDVLADGDEHCEHSNYCLTIVLHPGIAEQRFEVIKGLREAGVGTSMYYPGPVPHLSYYRDKYDLGGIEYPNAKRISDCSIALPVGPHCDEEDMHYIATTLKGVLGGMR